MIPSRTYGRPGLAAWRWKALRHELGDEHPSTRAAYGRYLAHGTFDEGSHHKAVPQRGSKSVESVAWHRESGAAPSYNNRHDRKRERRDRPPWV